jgi:hypothetical protein
MLLGEPLRPAAATQDRLAVPGIRDLLVAERRGLANARAALQSLRSRSLTPGVATRGLYSSDRLLAQSHWLLTVSSVLVGRSHFAVGRFLGCVVFPQEARPATFKSPVKYSLEFRLRLESPEPNLAGWPQPADSSLGLPLPTAHTRPEDPLLAGTPARFGPPSGFGDPLDGFRPSDPRRFCFAPAALLGFALRSFLLPNGIRGITTRIDPLAVSPAGFPIARGNGPAQQAAASGSLPPESPSRPDGGLVRQPSDAPLGFLHQLSPECSGEALAGLCVHLTSRRTLRPTARCSLASLYALPQPLRIGLRCQASMKTISSESLTDI